jgi:hypothetical protein
MYCTSDIIISDIFRAADSLTDCTVTLEIKSKQLMEDALSFFGPGTGKPGTANFPSLTVGDWNEPRVLPNIRHLSLYFEDILPDLDIMDLVITLCQYRAMLERFRLRVYSREHPDFFHNADQLAKRCRGDGRIELLTEWKRQGLDLFLLEGRINLHPMLPIPNTSVSDKVLA